MLEIAFVCGWVGLICYCWWDLARTPKGSVDTLPKWMWWAVILMPLVGATLWLLAGRPHQGDGLLALETGGDGADESGSRRSGRGARAAELAASGAREPGPEPAVRSGAGSSPCALGPDDDEEFLRTLSAQIARARRAEDGQGS